MTYELTPEEQAALDALLPMTKQSGDLRGDLVTAVEIAARQHRENARNGTAVLGALRRAAITLSAQHQW